jgi:hypothetical protein
LTASLVIVTLNHRAAIEVKPTEDRFGHKSNHW